MTEDRDIQRIAALLNLAQNAGTEGEREAALHHAMRWMSRRGIDEALVRGVDVNARTHDPMVMQSMVLPPPFSDVKANWFGAVAEVLGCQAVIFRDRATQRRRNRDREHVTYLKRVGPATLRLYGRASVVSRAMDLVRSLDIQCMFSLAAQPDCGGSPGRAFRRAYVAGFGQTCRDRMRAIVGEQTEAMTSGDAERYALVRQSDAAQVEAMVRRECGDLDAPKMRMSSAHGWSAGSLDAQRAELGQARLGTDRVAIGRGSAG